MYRPKLLLSVKSKPRYYVDAVEGIEHTTHPVFGFPWHPERMCFTQKRNDTVDGSAVFAHFLQLCHR